MMGNIVIDELETRQFSKMEIFAKTVNSFQTLSIFAKSCILDVWLGSECDFAVDFETIQYIYLVVTLLLWTFRYLLDSLKLPT